MSETTIYRVQWANVNRYQAFLFDVDEADATVDLWGQFAGVALAETWVPLPIYSDQPRLERPSFWHLVGAGVIVMDREVIDLVAQFVHSAGELLPLRETGTGGEFFALNILRDIDCLNPDAVRVEELNIRPDFLPRRLPESGLFKVPQLDTTHIFCLERSDDQESFTRAVDVNELTGLRFESVWNSTEGAALINLMIG